MSDYVGRDSFTGRLFQSRQLKDDVEDIKTAKEVVVVGANKGAWDVNFSAATSGAQVHMIIRLDDGGPSWVWPCYILPIPALHPKSCNHQVLHPLRALYLGRGLRVQLG